MTFRANSPYRNLILTLTLSLPCTLSPSKGDEKDLRLEAETEALKTEWLTDIRGLVAKLEENKVSYRSLAQSYPTPCPKPIPKPTMASPPTGGRWLPEPQDVKLRAAFRTAQRAPWG